MITVGLALTRRGRFAVLVDGAVTAEGVIGVRTGAGGDDLIDVHLLPGLLAERGYAVEDVDEWAVGGRAPAGDNRVRVHTGDASVSIEIAGDREPGPSAGPGEPGVTGSLRMAGGPVQYASYPHPVSQVALAYCTSPFVGRGEPAAVLVWDFDDDPRLYHVDAAGRSHLAGTTLTENGRAADLDERGGEPSDSGAPTRVLLRRLTDLFADGAVNLCFAGSRASDPTVNSLLRGLPAVRELWIPPFPDDSGSALAVAAAHLGRRGGLRAVRWTARTGGEPVRPTHLPVGWSVSSCRPEELARMLSRGAGPVVLLDGRAARGRGALATRGVLASATGAAELARGAGPEQCGPLDVVCLTGHAADAFDPGTPDPFRLYQHRIRPEWTDRIAAARHPDGTARLQTVDAASHLAVATILREYRTWSGLPMLYHLPAPDRDAEVGAEAAMRWGRTGLVWADGLLYRRKGADA